MTFLLQLLLIFMLGLGLLLLARFGLKSYPKWRTALTSIGALLMSFPFLLAIYLLLLILFGRG